MTETIIGFIIASGVLGLAANYIVSFAKWLRSVGVKNLSGIDPRALAAIASLVLAVGDMALTGNFDANQVTSYLEVISTWVVTWGVAHFTHRSNAV